MGKDALKSAITKKEKELGDWLAGKPPFGQARDIEFIKAAEGILSRLHHMQQLLDGPRGEGLPLDEETSARITSLLAEWTPSDRDNAGEAFEFDDRLKEEMPWVGDDQFLITTLQYIQASESRRKGWSECFPADLLQSLLAGWGNANAAPVAQHRLKVIRALQTYYQFQSKMSRHDRARTKLRELYLIIFSCVLLGALILLDLFVEQTIKEQARDLGLAMTAGIVGAALSRLMTIRSITAMRQLQAFKTAAFAQLTIGAAAGLIVAIALKAGIQIGDLIDTKTLGWQGLVLAAFAAGFSEPFFIKVLENISGVGDPPTQPPAPK